MTPPSSFRGINIDAYYAFSASTWVCAVLALTLTVLLAKSIHAPLSGRVQNGLRLTGLCSGMAMQAGIVLMYVLGFEDRSNLASMVLVSSAIATIGWSIYSLINPKKPVIAALGILCLLLGSALVVATAYGIN